MSRDGLPAEFVAQVGNGNGNSTLTSELKKILNSETEITINGKREKLTRAQLLAKVWYLKAKDGQFPFFSAMLDRTEGKVPDRIAGADGGAVQADVIAATIARIYPAQQVETVEVQALVAPAEQSTQEETTNEDD